MNRSATSTPRFWPFAILAYAAALAVGTLSANPLVNYAHDQAASYASDAAHQTTAATSLLELQTAQVLDPGNASYRQQLADRYVSQGDLNQAVSVLGSTGGERVRKASLLVRLGKADAAITAVQGVTGTDAAVVRSQAYLEEGRGASAQSAVQDLTSDNALVQLALVMAVNGKTSDVVELIPQADSATTKQRLRRIQSGGVALAQELYASGLYQTAERVLVLTPDSSAKSGLLAHVWLSKQPVTHQNLLAAQTAATLGLELDPANLPLHSLLQDIDSQLGDQTGATHQQQLINQLQSGKI
jgi:hypothetical protein